LPAVLALGFLPGCDEDYAKSMEYPIRTDPVLMAKALKEFAEPDPPGQLPLTAMIDLKDSRNPYFQDPDFLKDDKKIRNPVKQLTREDREELENVLKKVFGTPREPMVNDLVVFGPKPSEEVEKEFKALKLDDAILNRGSRMYRQQCLHCHGLTGDGRGQTAKWVNPHPRDYRAGLFKFQSVDQVIDPLNSVLPPRRQDLLRIIYNGVEGTSMPAFNLLPEEQREALASYVMHLSMRGEAELSVLKVMPLDDNNLLTTEKMPGNSIEGFLLGNNGYLRKIVGKWMQPQKQAIVPVPPPALDKDQLAASVERGRKMFTGVGKDGQTANCVSCHTDYGRQASYKFDDWGTLVAARNLPSGNFRGGRRPVDLFYRIHSGINGSGMTSFGGQLTNEQIWDLVRFVEALPYPAMREAYKIKIN